MHQILSLDERVLLRSDSAIKVNYALNQDTDLSITNVEPTLKFDPQGKAAAYQPDGNTILVLGMKTIQIEDALRTTISPNATLAAIVVKKENGKQYIRVSDHNFPAFDEIGQEVFSPDSNAVAYRAKLGSKEFIMTDDKQGPEFDAVGQPLFSPDSKTIGYRAKLGSKEFVMTGDKQGPEFDAVGLPVFSPDSKTVGYRAKLGSKEFVMAGDKQGPEFDAVGLPVFSPDSKTVSYGAKLGSKLFIMVGDKKGSEFDGVEQPVFSPDATTVSYGVRLGSKEFIMTGDKRGPEFDQIGGWMGANLLALKRFIRQGPIFSPDSKSIAYVARLDKKDVLMLNDNKVLEPDTSISSIRGITFSADGRNLAYIIDTRSNKSYIMVGKRKSPDYDYIDPNLNFTSDGKRLVFGAVVGHEAWWKVLDLETLDVLTCGTAQCK